MSSLKPTWQNGSYTNQHTEFITQNVEHQDATDIQKKTIFFVFFGFLFFYFIFYL